MAYWISINLQDQGIIKIQISLSMRLHKEHIFKLDRLTKILPFWMSKVSKPKYNAHWKNSLLGYCKHPESHETVWFDQDYVIIKDLYPKAKTHLLLMPRIETEFNLLNKAHIPMLERMVEIGNKYKLDGFKMGFHAVPSMRQLHMHIISPDFVSPCLKVKKHYLSFTTGFFKEPGDIIKKLASGVKLDFGSEEVLLKGELRCHHCGVVFKTMPKLKEHLNST